MRDVSGVERENDNDHPGGIGVKWGVCSGGVLRGGTRRWREKSSDEPTLELRSGKNPHCNPEWSSTVRRVLGPGIREDAD